MNVHERQQAPAPVRLLVAVDSGVDPHRLVSLCSRHPQADELSVSLLVVASPRPAEEWLRAVTTLLHWAGIRLEDIALSDHDPDLVEELVCEFDGVVVCTADRGDSSGVLGLVADVARRHGLSVDGDRRWIGRVANWIRSAGPVLLASFNPLWPRGT